jgi:RNA polymerase sigma-70 factor, ECF subfamily
LCRAKNLRVAEGVRLTSWQLAGRVRRGPKPAVTYLAVPSIPTSEAPVPPHDSGAGEALVPLVRAWRERRDEAAARGLMDALYPQVIKIVQNHLPRGGEPAELAHAVFVQFFRTLDRYDTSRPLANWVSRLALNVCLNALRSARRRPEVNWVDLTDDERRVAELLLSRAENEPTEAPAEESRGLLERLLATLEPQDRMLLVLIHLEERPVAEVARLLGCSRVVARMRAYRARRRLRQQIAAWGIEQP